MTPPPQTPIPSGHPGRYPRPGSGAPPLPRSYRAGVEYQPDFNPSPSVPIPSQHWVASPQHPQQLQYPGVPYPTFNGVRRDTNRSSISQFVQVDSQVNVVMAPPQPPIPAVYNSRQFWQNSSIQTPMAGPPQPGTYNFQQSQGLYQQQLPSLPRPGVIHPSDRPQYFPPVDPEYEQPCQCTECCTPLDSKSRSIPFPEFDQSQGKEHSGLSDFKEMLEKVSGMRFESYFALNEDTGPLDRSDQSLPAPTFNQPTYAAVAGRSPGAVSSEPAARNPDAEAWCPLKKVKNDCQLNHDTKKDLPNHFRPQDPSSRIGPSNKYVMRWLENVTAGHCPEDMTTRPGSAEIDRPKQNRGNGQRLTGPFKQDRSAAKEASSRPI